MYAPAFEGVTAKMVTTERMTSRVLFSGPEDGAPVLFLHGNTSSATWWEETMLALPASFRGIAPDQRGFGDADVEKKIDATQGLGDLADDAIALLDHLALTRCHLVGNSLGGNVVWRLMMDHPSRWISVTVISPGSPYGFGGTMGEQGVAIYDDFAGSGGGLSNPEFIQRMTEGDQSDESQFSPRNVLRALVFLPGKIPAWEDALLDAMLATHLGEQDMPGDFVPSENWPGIAPGIWGPTNALSPKYAADTQRLIDAEPKPSVLWVRGARDLAVSDASASDPGVLGKMGLLPGWPGEELYPAQPMVGQTRAVLEKYKAAGGQFKEVVIEDAAHVPFIDQPEIFNQSFHQHLQNGE